MKGSQSAGNLLVKIYENGNGVQIILEINISDMPALGIDTEHTEYTRIAVNEYEAYLFLASRDISFNVLTWATETAVFKLTSSIDIYDLIQIAEKITKK